MRDLDRILIAIFLLSLVEFVAVHKATVRPWIYIYAKQCLSSTSTLVPLQEDLS